MRVPPTRPDRSAPRPRRQYTQSAKIHDGNAEPIRLPESLSELPSDLREDRPRLSRQESVSPPRPPSTGPQRPAVERDDSEQRDWLVTSVLNALGRQPDEARLSLPERRSESGWGWLADGTVSRIARQAEATDAQEELDRDDPYAISQRDTLLAREPDRGRAFTSRERLDSAAVDRVARENELTGSIFSAREAALPTSFDFPDGPDSRSLHGGVDRWTDVEREDIDRDLRFTRQEGGRTTGGWNERTNALQRQGEAGSAGFSSFPTAADREPIRSTLYDPARESSSIFRDDPTYFSQGSGFDRTFRRTESDLATPSSTRSSAFDASPWDTPSTGANDRWSAPSTQNPAPRPLDPAPRRGTPPARTAPTSIHQMWD